MEKKIKVQFIINSLTSGGAEKVASDIINNLNKEMDVSLLLLEKDQFYKIDPEIKLKKLSNLKRESSKLLKILSYPYLLLRIINEIKKENPKVIVSFLEISNFLAITASKITKTPVIISLHTNPLIQYEKGILNRIINRLIKVLYNKANRIVVVSKALKKILIEEYNIPEDKIYVIYNPLNIEKILKKSKEKLEERHRKIFGDAFIFINIGRLTEAKGQWFLIRAFKKVNEKYPNTKLVIVGDGELKTKLEQLIKKLDLQDKVFLLGFQKNPYKFLARSDCFVLSSLWEGFSIVTVEALALNKIVISSDCEFGPREILSAKTEINKKMRYPYNAKYGVLIKPPPKEFIWKDLKEKPLTKEEIMLAEQMIKSLKQKKHQKRYKGIERAKDFSIKKTIKDWKNVIKTTTI